MSTIYLAAPWKCRVQARRARTAFRRAGISVNSRWLDFKLPKGERVPSEKTLCMEAFNDIEDICTADVLVVLNLAKSEGKAWEQGFAYARHLPIIGVGKPAHCVFHHLSSYEWVPTVSEAITLVRWLGDNQ